MRRWAHLSFLSRPPDLLQLEPKGLVLLEIAILLDWDTDDVGFGFAVERDEVLGIALVTELHGPSGGLG